MENRFAAEEFTDLQKMAVAHGFLEGEAESWYYEKQQSWFPLQNWDELKEGLLLRFRNFDDPERIELCLEHKRKLQEWELWLKSSSETSSSTVKMESDFKIGAHTVDETTLGKTITTSANTENQVRSSIPYTSQEEASLGYRMNHQSFENQEILFKKIEIPVFDGFIPYGWICRVERVFRAGQYSEVDKLNLVSMRLDGAALHWFRGEMSKNWFTNWSQFKYRMLTRFASEQNGSKSAKIPNKKSVSAAVPEKEKSDMSKSMATEELHVAIQAQELQKATDCVLSILHFPIELLENGDEFHETKLPLVEETYEKTETETSGSLSTKILQKELNSDSIKKTGPKCQSESVTTLEKSDSLEVFGSFTLVCIPPLQQIDKAKCEKLQEGLSKFSNESLESHSRFVVDQLAYDCGRSWLSVSKDEQFNTVYNEEVAALNHQARAVSDEEDVQVDYVNMQRFADVSWIQFEHEQIPQQKKCYKTWHFKYKKVRQTLRIQEWDEGLAPIRPLTKAPYAFKRLVWSRRFILRCLELALTGTLMSLQLQIVSGFVLRLDSINRKGKNDRFRMGKHQTFTSKKKTKLSEMFLAETHDHNNMVSTVGIDCNQYAITFIVWHRWKTKDQPHQTSFTHSKVKNKKDTNDWLLNFVESRKNITDSRTMRRGRTDWRIQLVQLLAVEGHHHQVFALLLTCVIVVLVEPMTVSATCCKTTDGLKILTQQMQLSMHEYKLLQSHIIFNKYQMVKELLLQRRDLKVCDHTHDYKLFRGRKYQRLRQHRIHSLQKCWHDYFAVWHCWKEKHCNGLMAVVSVQPMRLIR